MQIPELEEGAATIVVDTKVAERQYAEPSEFHGEGALFSLR